MLTDYSTDQYLSINDIAGVRNISKVDVEKVISVFGITVADKYRAPDKVKGRPANLYRRTEVEAAFVLVAEFKHQFAVVDDAEAQAAAAVSGLGNQATAQAA